MERKMICVSIYRYSVNFHSGGGNSKSYSIGKNLSRNNQQASGIFSNAALI